jgi:DNA-binding response OmpR family regulator
LVCTLAFTSGQVISCLTTQRYELFLLDVSLDEGRARELVSVARRVQVPVITVVSGLADGDMDWLVEDHVDVDASQGEVVGRCLAVVLMSRPVDLPGRIVWGPLELHHSSREGFWHSRPLGLTSIQYRLLEILALATGSIVTVSELARHTWGDNSFDDGERIAAHIRRIRKKIEANPSKATFLLTVRGQGFRLADCEVREPDVDLSFLQDDSDRPGETADS